MIDEKCCLPGRGAEVTVRYQDGRRTPAVVLSATPQRLVLNAAAGAEDLELSWTYPGGVAVLTGRVQLPGRERCTVTPTGGARTEQRRAYFRVAVGRPMTVLPMTLRVATSAEVNAPVAGHLVDVSEAGLRCWLPVRSPLPVGTRVLSRFTLAGTEFAVPGRVFAQTAAQPSAGPGRPAQAAPTTVIRFEQAGRDADALRGRVFAAELAARREPAACS
jgi:hypothetical protein